MAATMMQKMLRQSIAPRVSLRCRDMCTFQRRRMGMEIRRMSVKMSSAVVVCI